jgi:hypothetical protein
LPSILIHAPPRSPSRSTLVGHGGGLGEARRRFLPPLASPAAASSPRPSPWRRSERSVSACSGHDAAFASSCCHPCRPIPPAPLQVLRPRTSVGHRSIVSTASVGRPSTVSTASSDRHQPHRPPVGLTPRAKVGNAGEGAMGSGRSWFFQLCLRGNAPESLFDSDFSSKAIF